MKKNNYTHAAMIPLIGGVTLAQIESLNGKLPEYILSYSPFKDNDAHCINYLKTKKKWKGEYVLIDENPNYKPKNVDIVHAVCPCAGLSSLSPSPSANSPTNSWMYESTEYVLKNINPKVLWGENAPRLSTPFGMPVADKLRKIGKKYGYNLMFYYTRSRHHGLAQIRLRTFYMFFKDDMLLPVFPYFDRPMQPIQDILSLSRDKSDPMNVLINNSNPYEHPYCTYVLEHESCKTFKELFDKLDSSKSFFDYILKKTDYNLFAFNEWYINRFGENINERLIARHERMMKKFENKKGVFCDKTMLPKNGIGAFVGALPGSMINPFHDSYITFREAMRIMRLPDDFDLLNFDNPNVICQNVPVTTAKDISDSIIRHLSGEINETKHGSFMLQDNSSVKNKQIKNVFKRKMEFSF